MKKVFVSAIAIICLLFICVLPILAEEYYISVDFSKSYILPKNDGAITLRYNPGGLFTDVRASTDVSVSNDAKGEARVVIMALNGKENESFSREDVNNVINSGKASVSGQDYAKWVHHRGRRNTGGLYQEWDYYCE